MSPFYPTTSTYFPSIKHSDIISQQFGLYPMKKIISLTLIALFLSFTPPARAATTSVNCTSSPGGMGVPPSCNRCDCPSTYPNIQTDCPTTPDTSLCVHAVCVCENSEENPTTSDCVYSGMEGRYVCNCPHGTLLNNCTPSGGTCVCASETPAESDTVPTFNLCAPTGDLQACTNCQSDGGVWTALGCLHWEPQTFITDFLKIALGIAGGVALLLMVYGSFLISTSAGNPKKSEEGKEIITGTIAGLLFIIFSAVLLRLIGVDILNIPGL